MTPLKPKIGRTRLHGGTSQGVNLGCYAHTRKSDEYKHI